MRKLGVLLALLVLLGTLAVGTGQVSALASDWVLLGSYVAGSSSVSISDVDNATLIALHDDGSDGTITEAMYLYNRTFSPLGPFSITYKALKYLPGSSDIYGFGVYYVLDVGSGVVVMEYYTASSNLYPRKLSDEGVSEISGESVLGEYRKADSLIFGNVTEFSKNLSEIVADLQSAGATISESDVQSVQVVVATTLSTSSTNGASMEVYVYSVGAPVQVTFNLKDGLTGESLSGVTVKNSDGSILGTVDDGGSLEILPGTYTLTFEKSGYWSVQKTIDVQGDTSVSVEMYPSSAAFKLENFPADIKIPENTIYELTFTLSPIDTSATYNTYLSLSGLSNVISVEKDGSAISPEGGKYYLGDISSPVQVSIKFKAGAVGQHGFTLTLTSNDAIMSKTYTTTKQVTYQVEPLPFSVQMPSEWQVGQNELRISESSGQSYLITAVLKDSQGNEVWSDSHAFSPYEAYSFQVSVPSEGSYTLELQWNGQVAVYDVTVNPAITLVTKTLTVSEGGEGTIVLHFKNPSSDVQYYTIVVSGGFLPAEINQSISVAPLTEKDVSIAFAVPEDLTYDAYELNVAVLQGNATVFQDKVAVSISEGSGFTLFGGGSGGNTWLWIGAGALGLLLLIALARRR